MKSCADENCGSRCVEQGITYVRLNPQLEEEIDSGETDNDKLLNMLWVLRQYLYSAAGDGSLSKMDTISQALI